MNENKLARAIVAQTELNFALIGLLLKMVDASSLSNVTEEVRSALSEVLNKNSEVVEATKVLVGLSMREDSIDG